MPRLILLLPVMLWLTACAATSGPDGLTGMCAALAPLGASHAAALVADGGDQSVVTGERLLAGIDAGCN